MLKPETTQAIMNMDIAGYEVDWLLTRDNPYPQKKWQDNLIWNLNKAQKMARGYDYLMTIEHDIVVPVDTLIKLINCNVAVVSGLYRLRPGHGANPDNIPLAVLKFEPGIEEGLPGSLTYHSLGEKWLEGKDIIVQVDAVGYGCCLFRNDILYIPFDMDLDYSHRLKTNGVPMYVCSQVKCDHIDEDGSIIKV